jgi:hypothetical protein
MPRCHGSAHRWGVSRRSHGSGQLGLALASPALAQTQRYPRRTRQARPLNRVGRHRATSLGTNASLHVQVGGGGARAPSRLVTDGSNSWGGGRGAYGSSARPGVQGRRRWRARGGRKAVHVRSTGLGHPRVDRGSSPPVQLVPLGAAYSKSAPGGGGGRARRAVCDSCVQLVPPAARPGVSRGSGAGAGGRHRASAGGASRWRRAAGPEVLRRRAKRAVAPRARSGLSWGAPMRGRSARAVLLPAAKGWRRALPQRRRGRGGARARAGVCRGVAAWEVFGVAP